MADILRVHRSNTVDVAPGSLNYGEFGVNIADKRIWIGDAFDIPVLLSTPHPTTYDYIDLNNAGSPAWREGRLFWDGVEHALSYYNDDEDITINVGQELVAKVRNNTATTIVNGSAVYVTGAVGNRPTVALAQGDAAATARVVGVMTHDLAKNGDGYVTLIGVVRGFDTGAWPVGTLLYLSTTTPGGLTDVKSGFGDAVASVTLSHGVNGWLYVRPRDLWSLDVPTDGDVHGRYWDGSTHVWTPARHQTVRRLFAGELVFDRDVVYDLFVQSGALAITLGAGAKVGISHILPLSVTDPATLTWGPEFVAPPRLTADTVYRLRFIGLPDGITVEIISLDDNA